MNALGGWWRRDLVKSPSRSQRLTQPPNPRHVQFNLCFLRAYYVLGPENCWVRQISRYLVLRKQSERGKMLARFPFSSTASHHSVGLGLKIVTPSQVGISFPLDFWKESSLASSLSQRVAYAQQFQSGREGFSLPPFRKSSSSGLVCYKNLAFEISLGINTHF